MNRALSTNAAVAWRHGPTEGLPSFRAALAHRFGGDADHVLVISGAQQGLDLLTRCLVDRGDAVIVDRPGYLGAIQSFRNAGARLVGWDIVRADVDELEELLLRYRPKLIYTNPTHQNPTGITLPMRARRDLLELATRYRVPIVEDDTYRELGLESTPPPSLFKLDDARNIVIRLNSFSKMLAPGLRLGWISAVGPIVEQLALIRTRRISCSWSCPIWSRAACSIDIWRRCAANTGAGGMPSCRPFAAMCRPARFVIRCPTAACTSGVNSRRACARARSRMPRPANR